LSTTLSFDANLDADVEELRPVKPTILPEPKARGIISATRVKS
jgi:hypothetical protein